MRPRRAFSLIELLLAIALSITLVALLGSAINLHLIRLDDSRSTVEQAQLARSVLDRMASDLRGVTTAPTQDVSELLATAEAGAQFNADGLDDEAADPDADESNSAAETLPGLNGLADSMTLDIRRVSQSLATIDPAMPPSARINAAWSRVSYGMSLLPEQPGLVRAETSHDAALWSEQQGVAPPVVAPMASEVIGLSLQYFDGARYLPQWSMDEQQAAPVGVLITLRFTPADDAGDPTSPNERREPRTYQRYVRLPAAAAEATESDESAADGASSAAGASSGV